VICPEKRIVIKLYSLNRTIEYISQTMKKICIYMLYLVWGPVMDRDNWVPRKIPNSDTTYINITLFFYILKVSERFIFYIKYVTWYTRIDFRNVLKKKLTTILFESLVCKSVQKMRTLNRCWLYFNLFSSKLWTSCSEWLFRFWWIVLIENLTTGASCCSFA